MKLLFDANISWRIVKLTAPVFDSLHVEQSTLPIPATDSEIWSYARENDFIIVTNDEDFINLAVAKGFPPKIIILRTGNQKTRAIADILLTNSSRIIELEMSEIYGILEIV